MEILAKDIQSIADLGVEIHTSVRIDSDEKLAELKKEYDAVILAGGCQLPKQTALPGSEAAGFYWGLDFMMQAEGINLSFLASPLKVLSSDGKITGLSFIRNAIQKDRSIRPIEGSEFTIDADCVTLAIGQKEQSDLFTDVQETGRERDFDFIPLQAMPETPLSQRREKQKEVETGFTEELSLIEARRIYPNLLFIKRYITPQTKTRFNQQVHRVKDGGHVIYDSSTPGELSAEESVAAHIPSTVTGYGVPLQLAESTAPVYLGTFMKREIKTFDDHVVETKERAKGLQVLILTFFVHFPIISIIVRQINYIQVMIFYLFDLTICFALMD